MRDRRYARASHSLCYLTNPRDWETRDWYDLHNTASQPLHIGPDIELKRIRRVVRDYRLHPESKSVAPDGSPCRPTTSGLLGRQVVTLEGITHIGKESNKLEQQQEAMISDFDEILTDYGAPDGSSNA